MNWKKKQLRESNLYVLIDTRFCLKKMSKLTDAAIRGGADIIQLRNSPTINDKELLRCAKDLRRRLKDRLFILNNRPDIALACGADGVHLGQDDMPVPLARKILGVTAIIGKSCQSTAHIRSACKEGADYVAIGPVFKTETKPDTAAMDIETTLTIAQNRIPIPLFAIGGINLERLAWLLSIGIRRVAVCGDIMTSDIPRHQTRLYKNALKQACAVHQP